MRDFQQRQSPLKYTLLNLDLSGHKQDHELETNYTGNNTE